MVYAPTSQSARAFAEQGRIEEWIHLFLCAEGGNVPFSDGLKKMERCYRGLISFPIGHLERCCGPEEGMPYPEPMEGFERRVAGLMDALRAGMDIPPLIVNYDEDALTVNDGSHRLEAIKRLGYETFPIILWTTGQEDMDQFHIKFGL